VALPTSYRSLVLLEFALAVPTFLSLVFIPAPYGRYSRGGWGWSLAARWGWILMESPAPVFFAVVYFRGAHALSPSPLALFALWQLHYLYRAFLFPLRMREGARRMPVAIAAMAVAFNLLNAFVNARYVSTLGSYPPAWLADPRFLLGALVFLGGFALNVASDRTLRGLRAPGETAYRIPRGGAFEWVSCPNYLGEMVEWAGWAVASWSLAGLAFAVYTAANLAPRAFAHHAWYRRQFADYPARRRALIPFVC